MSRRLSLVVLLAVFPFVAQHADAADWLRLQSANFTVEGDVGERELRAVARRLEQFREVIGRALPSVKLVTPAPVTVLVFGRVSDFKSVSLLFQGKPIELAGYAVTSPIGSSIAICVERSDQAYPVAYHEYGHLLISNSLYGLPLWLKEGLAEFYGTFDLSEDGRRATLGKPVAPEEIGLLRDRLLPMSELLAADEGSKLYNVGADRDLFYAQSWALVHYLMLGNPDRARQFEDFLQRLAVGVPAARAYTDSFPQSEKLEAEVSAYIGRMTIKVRQVPFTDRVSGATDYTLTRMTPAEAIAVLGSELTRQRRFDEAKARFDQAIKLAPETASAQTGLGLVFTLQGLTTEGLRALRKGAELADGDAMAHFAFGYGALQCISADCLREQGGKETARREFQRSVDLLPQFPEALALLGWAEAFGGGDLASAERHLLQAIEFLPGRDDYRLNLAQVYLRRNEFTKARALLGPIAASSPSPAQKASARQLLGQAAEMMRMAELRAAPPLPADPAAPALEPGPPSSGTRGAGSEVVPVYRDTKEGERRVQGELSAIECRAGAAVVVVRVGAVSHRFWAPSLDKIDFITYRNDLKGSVSCGPQGGAMQVYLTSRAAAPGEPALPAGTEGRAVAIEYLPVK